MRGTIQQRDTASIYIVALGERWSLARGALQEGINITWKLPDVKEQILLVDDWYRMNMLHICLKAWLHAVAPNVILKTPEKLKVRDDLYTILQLYRIYAYVLK